MKEVAAGRNALKRDGKHFCTSSLLKGKMAYSFASSVGAYFSHAQ
jgi:hypothetical protein